MWVLLYDLFSDNVVCLRLQPSLSLLDASQTTFRAASAFFLQAFTQSCVMVGLMSYLFAWMKACFAGLGRSDRQIANTDIHANDCLELLLCWRLYVNGEGNEEVETFLWLVVPELGIADAGSTPNECHMLIIALVGDADASPKRPDTDPTTTLKGIVTLIGILDGGRTVRGRFVQTL